MFHRPLRRSLDTYRGQKVGRWLALGINKFNENTYGPVTPPFLRGCVNDMEDMAAIARSRGFLVNTLRDEQATAHAVLDSLSRAAAISQPGDIFVMSASTHGTVGDDPERLGDPDGIGEFMVAYDAMIADNTFWAKWGEFRTGVRVLVILDICFGYGVPRIYVPQLMRLHTQLVRTGEVQRDGSRPDPIESLGRLGGRDVFDLALDLVGSVGSVLEGAGVPVTGAPVVVKDAVATVMDDPQRGPAPVEEQVRLYDSQRASIDIGRRNEMYRSDWVPAHRLVDPGCTLMGHTAGTEKQTVSDGRPDATGRQNGLFTSLIKRTWQDSPSYQVMMDEIGRLSPSTQTPMIFMGTDAFLAERPFTI